MTYIFLNVPFWASESFTVSRSTMDHLSLGRSSPDLLAIGNGGGNDDEAPQLVYQGERAAVYRLRDKGFKVIVDPSPSDEQILRLVHEQHISNFLPSSCRKKNVIEVSSFNGRPALCFKWVNGITLKEWLQKDQFRPQVDLNVRLRAAMAIAKTLSDFHDGGVVCNRLSPENIVLDTFEGDYIATLIDFSDAIVYRDGKCLPADAAFAREVKEVDLKSLGFVLNQLFRGEECLPDEWRNDFHHHHGGGLLGDQDKYRRKRGKQLSPGEGLPLYLGALISALLQTGDHRAASSGHYESAKDVFLDLKIMAESDNECLKKCDLDESTIEGRLRLRNDMFYGRQVQMSMLLHLFQSTVMLGNQPLMATISGYPGTG